MKILPRYLLRQIAFPFGVSLLLLSFMLILNKLLTLVDLVLKYGVDLGAVSRLVLYILPSTFAVTVPMSLLVGAMVTLSRMAADLELIAIKAGAVSLGCLLRPLLGLGMAFSILMLAFNELILPQANQAYKLLFYDIISQHSSVAIQENAWIHDFEGMILRVDAKAARSDRLDDITLIKLANEREPLQWIQARWGRLISDKSNFRVFLELHDGSVQFLGKEGMKQLTSLSFRSSRVDLDMTGTLHRQVQGAGRQPQEMTVRALWGALAAMPAADPQRSHFGVEMHKKIAIPFACLCFLVAAFPLGVLARRGGRMLGFSLSLGLIFAYYLLLSLGQTYGDTGRLPSWLAMWLPNVFMLLLGAPWTWVALKEKFIFPLR